MNQIVRINAALLVRDQTVVDPETGEAVVKPIDPKVIKSIESLVSSAIGLKPERGDTLIVNSQPFLENLPDALKIKWFEADWVKDLGKQAAMILMLAVVSLGVIRPLLSRLLVPAGGEVVASGGVSEDDEASESIEVSAGETLEEIKAKLKPKKASISMEMLDTANTYDDKVALIRMIVGDEAGRVSNVFKQMMQKDMDMLG